MITRAELKKRGKAAFKKNYWKTVLVAFILSICAGGVGAATGSSSFHGSSEETTVNEQADQELTEEDLNQLIEELEGQDSEIPDLEQALQDSGIELGESSSSKEPASTPLSGLAAALAAISLTISAIGTLLKVLLLNPVEIGCRSFFVKNLHEAASEGEIKNGFSQYARNVGAMLLREIFQVLWTLLFIIPGIVKAYSYRMVPYILAEDPSCGAREAITRSRRMMNGHKWDTFVLDLSFIGWYLLSVLTLGILLIFWVNPYHYNTDAALYEQLRNEYRAG